MVNKPLMLSGLALVFVLGSCTQGPVGNASGGLPFNATYQIVSTYPHDPAAFTQGLVYHDGVFYESTGLRGESSLRRVELETGRVLQRLNVPDRFFSEGLALWEDRLIQLTWTSGRAFAYDRETFEKRAEFSYPTEGWGLTHDGERLIMSDGTNTLYFRDPDTFEETGRVVVRDGDSAVGNLNELEYIEGEVWANVWLTDRIVRIDPETGEVQGWIDLSGLLPPNERTSRTDVLNGIAYDPDGERVFVTGKLWPKLFEIELVAP